ncbi:DUF4407 domain-containing protein [Flavobacterium cyclinae]|uniref:DUF4407 domain-containing protein n=1 Tax=Flavobacterium cyclinae TaxID=2895947 RepID=UPI001E559067|nr:DUF4407 domain-containing protein [Flavobacterium cyclinae]UGS19875.1 DUF4407 domain-containing protein [Flavobacterium cyclinae]
MTRDYYQLPKAGKVMQFLWKCAGGDKYLLERATYSDQIKYMCLGGIVFATGAMAGLAGGYAFYTIFSPKSSNVINKTKTIVDTIDNVSVDTTTLILSIIFGIIWGLIIFNIDRFIVTSTGKGDGTEEITWLEFKTAIPRILMGMIIAITISKPIEIRMFQTEINLAVQKEQEKEKNSLIAQANSNYEAKVKEIKVKLGQLQTTIDEKNRQVADLRIEISKEITGKNNNGDGFGPRARELERQADLLETQIKALENTEEYKNSLQDRRRYELQKQKDIEIAEKKGASLDGLLIRIQKAHEIAGFWISLFITLLFMAIELTPIFFKLMLTKTTYDYLAENRDELIKADYGIEVQYDKYKDKEGVERHLVINHEAEKLIYEKIKVTEIQKELTDYAVQKYKEREMKKIDENLDTYISTINNGEKNS